MRSVASGSILFAKATFMQTPARHYEYRNDLNFSDRYAWANSADPDQTAPRGAV